MREIRRAQAAEIRAVDEPKRQFTARVVNYNVADTYGTVWRPGVFTDSLQRRKPYCVWGHDWNDPIGRVISHDDGNDGLDVTVQLDDFDAVPRAKQAWSQLRSGSIDQFSFGFVRKDWTPVEATDRSSHGDHEAREYMDKADLEEVSPVLIGSVPGTRPLAVRSVLNASLVQDVAALLKAEVIDQAEARQILEGAADLPEDDGPDPGTDHNPELPEGGEGSPKVVPEPDKVDQEGGPGDGPSAPAGLSAEDVLEIEEALELVARSR